MNQPNVINLSDKRKKKEDKKKIKEEVIVIIHPMLGEIV